MASDRCEVRVRVPSREGALKFLEIHNAAGVAHFNGTLQAHLERTEGLLREWGAGEALCRAGLCHAAYGTDGFANQLVAVADRQVVVDAIGVEAETIVYRYASCDRGLVYPQLGIVSPLRFRDRFNGHETTLAQRELAELLELTFANELDIVRTAPPGSHSEFGALRRLLRRCEGLVSDRAFESFLDVFT
jgi:hypothetical protein